MVDVIKFFIKVPAYLVLLFSFITPRFRNIWIYGSNMGFVGNAKYMYIHTSTHTKIHSIWIGSKTDVSHIQSLGLQAYYRYSFKGLLYALIGGVYIYNSYVSDINLYTWGRAKRINLWHGVGIKNCERKISTGPLARIFQTKNVFIKLKYLPFFVKPHLFLSTSDQMTNLCMECFGITQDKFVENMYPRCDIFMWSEQRKKQFILRYENAKTLNLVNLLLTISFSYLYMPTWRDSGYDFLHDFDYSRLNAILRKRNEILLLKLHPVTKLNIDADFSNIIIVDKAVDLNSIMSYTDCLITDYSSVYYDYITIPNKRMILYIPDYEHYISRDRDLAFDYMDSTEGEFARSFKELCDLIEFRERDQFLYPRMSEIKERFWGCAEGSDVNDLCDKIMRYIQS